MKAREWKLVEGEDNKRHLQELTELDKSYLSKFGVLAACNSIHVREVLPSCPSCPACNEEYDCKVCGHSSITDSQRLEFVIENKKMIHESDEGFSIMDEYKTPDFKYFKTPREAIDAAMKESNDK